jgi:hypothetical protein
MEQHFANKRADQGARRKPRASWRARRALLVISAIIQTAAYGQTFTTLASLTGLDGVSPLWGSLVQGIDGNYYGTASEGGSSGVGPECRSPSWGRA